LIFGLVQCHHVGAVSFDAILKQVKAKYVLGLTATPIRRDGQQPIIFMQCGPIRYTAAKPASAPHDLEVVPQLLHTRIDLPQDAGIQDVFRHLAIDENRTSAIASQIAGAFNQGRKVLVLTERTAGAAFACRRMRGLQRHQRAPLAQDAGSKAYGGPEGTRLSRMQLDNRAIPPAS
jgi:superfamily II DNA or RNA helicase